ncbi:hypothetical protein KAJ27_13155, partial [bacterium]|nr:hypothetical protein [bacterium]
DGRMDHTTVFYKDGKRAPGILSPDDLILMAGHDGVHIVKLSAEIKHDRPTRIFITKFKKL